MPRKARAEVEGGLYQVITRGNNRRQIFSVANDYEKFLALLAAQKTKLPFFLYAYCLMSNHVHLLIERQAGKVGEIMQRVLTGYAQYYNRRYHRVGHLLQGRYKAILCQSDRYLSELVRYIHLNPVRARMVNKPEDYAYSSHRAYLGLDPTRMVDVDPVLRHFGTKRAVALERYRQFVTAGMRQGHRQEFYGAEGGRILGGEEFVDAIIHRIGETTRTGGTDHQTSRSATCEVNISRLITAVEKTCGIPQEEFLGLGKTARAVGAKEMLILTGRELGASLKVLGETIGLSSGTASRRCDAARQKVRQNREIARLVEAIRKQYQSGDD